MRVARCWHSLEKFQRDGEDELQSDLDPCEEILYSIYYLIKTETDRTQYTLLGISWCTFSSYYYTAIVVLCSFPCCTFLGRWRLLIYVLTFFILIYLS